MPDLSSFPTDALPGRWAEYVGALSESLQVPVDLPAMMLLGMWATALQGKYRIHAWGDWHEPLCLWTCIVLDPANRKSAVVEKVKEPVYRYEREERKVQAPIRAQVLARREALEEQIAALDKLIAKDEATPADLSELDALRAELESVPEPAELPEMFGSDISPEALGTLLQAQGRITLASDEGAEVFGIAAGRYSDKANFDIFLKGHSGSSHTVHRIGRPSLHLKRATVSMAISIQGEVLDQLGRDTTGMRGRGLLGRFLWSIPKSPLGSRIIRTEAVPLELAEWFESNLIALLGLPGQRTEGAWDAQLIRLSPAAQGVLEDWAARIEPQLGPMGRFADCKDWAGKLAGATLRIAGLLHGAESPHVNPSARCVSGDTLERAVAIARYCIEHALAVFERMGTKDELQLRASKVVQWAVKRGEPTFTERDVWQTLRKSFDSDVNAIRPALDLLAARRYARLLPALPRTGPGRKPSPKWALNPALLPRNSHNPQNGGKRPPSRGERGPPPGTRNPSTGTRKSHPRRSEPSARQAHTVELADPEDPVREALVDMADRGVRVDPDLWCEAWRAAVAELEQSDAEGDASALRSLEAYAPEIDRQARGGDGRVRCSWVEQGAGRLGAVRPCLQGIPKAHGLRAAFLPEEGFVFIRADWSSMHVWIAAGHAGDEALLEDLAADGLYERVAREWAVPLKVAKRCLLARFNGEGHAAQGQRLGVTAHEAGKRWDTWQARYPALRAWLRQRSRLRSWETPLGRTVTLPEDREDYTAVGWTLQSIESDALRLVLQRCPWPIVLTVHDEVLIEVPEEDAEQAAADLRGCMNDALLEVARLPQNRGLATVRIDVRNAWGEEQVATEVTVAPKPK